MIHVLSTAVVGCTSLTFFHRDLSDLNKDGNLDLDEFVIAMHLIDLAKSGQSLPATLPAELIPATKNSPPEAEGHAQDTASDGKRGRSESISSIGKPELGIVLLDFA